MTRVEDVEGLAVDLVAARYHFVDQEGLTVSLTSRRFGHGRKHRALLQLGLFQSELVRIVILAHNRGQFDVEQVLRAALLLSLIAIYCFFYGVDYVLLLESDASLPASMALLLRDYALLGYLLEIDQGGVCLRWLLQKHLHRHIV